MNAAPVFYTVKFIFDTVIFCSLRFRLFCSMVRLKTVNG